MNVYISAIINPLKALQILKQNQNKQDFCHFSTTTHTEVCSCIYFLLCSPASVLPSGCTGGDIPLAAVAKRIHNQNTN